MSHPAIANASPFAVEPLFLTDEEGRPIVVVVVKGSFEITGREARLVLAEKQAAVNMAGEYWGDPEASSYKYEPEIAFDKRATDVALIGHAYEPGGDIREIDVSLRVGPLRKVARVFGDRFWVKELDAVRITKPEAIDRIPLIAERAFGGWDRSHPNPEKHRFEPRNPVGTGYRHRSGEFEEGARLPNLEDPDRLIRGYRDVVPPTGFGFTGPHWDPRCKLAGTYDEKWAKNRSPLLPTDFDRRFFNAASPGLTAPGFLRGDEPVTVLNTSPTPTVSFALPGFPPPKVRVEVQDMEDQNLQTNLDTVIIDMDEKRVSLLWRCHLRVPTGPTDVRTIEVQCAR